MTDTTDDARAERAEVHQFTLDRLDAIRAVGGDPNAFAQAMLAEAVGLMQVLRGPGMAAGELAHMAAQIAARDGVAGHA